MKKKSQTRGKSFRLLHRDFRKRKKFLPPRFSIISTLQADLVTRTRKIKKGCLMIQSTFLTVFARKKLRSGWSIHERAQTLAATWIRKIVHPSSNNFRLYVRNAMHPRDTSKNPFPNHPPVVVCTAVLGRATLLYADIPTIRGFDPEKLPSASVFERGKWRGALSQARLVLHYASWVLFPFCRQVRIMFPLKHI